MRGLTASIGDREVATITMDGEAALARDATVLAILLDIIDNGEARSIPLTADIRLVLRQSLIRSGIAIAEIIGRDKEGKTTEAEHGKAT